MFDNFLNFFDEKNTCIIENTDVYENFLKCLGGKQFGNGLFTTFEKKDLEKWTLVVNDAYQNLSGNFNYLVMIGWEEYLELVNKITMR